MGCAMKSKATSQQNVRRFLMRHQHLSVLHEAGDPARSSGSVGRGPLSVSGQQLPLPAGRCVRLPESVCRKEAVQSRGEQPCTAQARAGGGGTVTIESRNGSHWQVTTCFSG